MTDILGIGNALVDALVQVKNEVIINELGLQKGGMQLIDTERYLQVQERIKNLNPVRTTGGSACNTLLAVAQLGGRAGLIGNVGRDEPGEFFANSFKALGVDTLLSYDDCLPTGVASTLITPDGQRTFGTYLGAAANLQPQQLKAEWFDSYRYFYIEGYLVQDHALIRRAVELAREAGLKVCIDLASYNIVADDRDFFAELLPQVDIVFANEQEAVALTGCDDATHNVAQLARLCHIAVVKVGKRGVLVQRGTERIHCAAREVPHVVDTTAAGDYFAAGFMFALSQGRSLMTCARLGSLLAGHIIEVVGTALSADTWQRIKLAYEGFEA